MAAFSLRDAAQLLKYSASKSAMQWVTYDPAHDPDPRRQDAAKVAVPPFVDLTTLAAPVAAGDSTITVAESRAAFLSTYAKNRQVRVDKEIMTITDRSGSTLTVKRAELGTAAAAHEAGAPVGPSTDSLPNQILLPLATQGDHTYLMTWDAWFGRETRRAESGLVSWKTFRIDTPRKIGGAPGPLFQVNTKFSLAPSPGDIGMLDALGTAPLGPGVTSPSPLSPQTGSFVIEPETWVRYWVQLEQHSDGWDLFSLWGADENHDPVQLLDRIPLETFGDTSVFRFEFNTSSWGLVANRGDMVSYVRNFVMLRDVANPTALMQRPLAGLALPATGPSAPRNLRIVR